MKTFGYVPALESSEDQESVSMIGNASLGQLDECSCLALLRSLLNLLINDVLIQLMLVDSSVLCMVLKLLGL